MIYFISEKIQQIKEKWPDFKIRIKLKYWRFLLRFPDWLLRLIGKNRKQLIVLIFLQTEEGRKKLAASMLHPIRMRMDYTELARKTFKVEPLLAGALPIYDRDPGVADIIIKD